MSDDRPGSRAPSGVQQRPMTSNRPMSSFARPGTASRHAAPTALGRPGTASRLAQQMQAGINVQSARPGTRGGVVPATAYGRVDRPLTQYGLPRTGTAAGGQGRVVQDRTYWVNVIKFRLQALRTENEIVQRDVQQMNTDAGTLATYQQEAERAAQELSNLRGELNDYGRLLDNSLNIDDLEKARRQTEANNVRLQRQLDELYGERKARQNEVAQWRARLEELNNKETSLTNRMHAEQRATYEKFKQAMQEILKDLRAKQAELDKLKQRRVAVVSQIQEQHNDERVAAVGVLEQLFSLSDKIKAEEEEIADTETVEQKQSKLQAMVKLHTEEIDTLQKQIKSYERQIEQTRETLQEFETSNDNTDGKKQDRFRQLNEKVREMQDFLHDFDDRKQDLQNEITRRTEQVGEQSRRVEQLKKDIAAYDADVGDDVVNSVGNTAEKLLQTKTQKTPVAAGGDSVEALQAQAEDCRVRMLKISQLEAKLATTKQNCENDIASTRAEHNKIRNPEQHAAELRQTISQLETQTRAASTSAEHAESDLRAAENSISALKKENESHSHHSELVRLEHKLQQLESQRSTLETELSVKRDDMNSDTVRDQVMHQVRTLNKALQLYYAQRKIN